MNRSWFYLTLWRGTPPEFTNEFDAQIQTSDSALVQIKTMDAAQSSIGTLASFAAQIKNREAFNAEINMATEVTWYVN